MPAAKSPELRRRAVGPSSWPGYERIRSPRMAKDLGIAESGLRCWVKQADIEEGKQEGLTSYEHAEMVQLRRGESRYDTSRRVRRLPSLGGSGSWDHRAIIQRTFGNGRCGWSTRWPRTMDRSGRCPRTPSCVVPGTT